MHCPQEQSLRDKTAFFLVCLMQSLNSSKAASFFSTSTATALSFPPLKMSADFKNPHLEQEEDKNTLILTAAAKGAGLALVAGGLVAFWGKRHSTTYQNLSKPMKTFLLGSGNALLCL